MILDTQLAFVVAAIVQAFLYGLYLVSLAHALRWLLYEEEGWSLRSRSKVNWPLSIITIILFVFSTTDVAFIISRLLTFSDATGELITKQFNIASLAIENATLLTTDAVLIIRCWTVYQRSGRVVSLPIMLWLANLACMILWLVTYTTFVLGATTPESQITPRSFQVLYCCHFVTNLYATSAILYRLWSVARENNSRASILFRVCRIVATTGILYTCTSLSLVVTTFYIDLNRPGYLLCDAINFSVAGITFNLLQIRVGQLRAEVKTCDHESACGTRGSVLLSTVQFNIAANDHSLDSTNTLQRNQTDTKIEENDFRVIGIPGDMRGRFRDGHSVTRSQRFWLSSRLTATVLPTLGRPAQTL